MQQWYAWVVRNARGILSDDEEEGGSIKEVRGLTCCKQCMGNHACRGEFDPGTASHGVFSLAKQVLISK